jgi:hypothetical protein
MGITARQRRIVAGRSAFSSGLLQTQGGRMRASPSKAAQGRRPCGFTPKIWQQCGRLIKIDQTGLPAPF